MTDKEMSYEQFTDKICDEALELMANLQLKTNDFNYTNLVIFTAAVTLLNRMVAKGVEILHKNYEQEKNIANNLTQIAKAGAKFHYAMKIAGNMDVFSEEEKEIFSKAENNVLNALNKKYHDC
jgi:hypothetical protein